MVAVQAPTTRRVRHKLVGRAAAAEKTPHLDLQERQPKAKATWGVSGLAILHPSRKEVAEEVAQELQELEEYKTSTVATGATDWPTQYREL